ncbi:MAG: DUF1778 domain-containing protein [Pseudomonadota bacterium]
MTAKARFDLQMDADEKALALLDRESRVTLSKRDFAAFTRALNGAFTLKPALKRALAEAKTKVRRT